MVRVRVRVTIFGALDFTKNVVQSATVHPAVNAGRQELAECVLGFGAVALLHISWCARGCRRLVPGLRRYNITGSPSTGVLGRTKYVSRGLYIRRGNCVKGLEHTAAWLEGLFSNIARARRKTCTRELRLVCAHRRVWTLQI